MKQQFEELSACVDGEHDRSDVLSDIAADKAMTEKWQRYHLIGQAMRKELPDSLNLDLSSKIADAIANEPTVLAPKRQWRDLPLMSSVVPLFKQGGQLAVAASVALAVVVGVQQVNQPEELQPFNSELPLHQPMGGLSPVSLEKTRALPRADAMEQRLIIEAYLKDHQRQLRMKPAVESEQARLKANSVDAKDTDENTSNQ